MSSRIDARAAALAVASLVAAAGLRGGAGAASTACRPTRWPSRSSSAPTWQSTADDPEFYMRGTVVDVGLRRRAGRPVHLDATRSRSRASAGRSPRTRSTRASPTSASPAPTARATRTTASQRKTTNDGQIVASYKIVSHFDIKRDYNPQTGESSTSSWRTRPTALVRARVLPRRLVEEPGHRRLRLRHAVAHRRDRRRRVRAARLHRARSDRPRRAALRRRRRATSTSPTRRTPSRSRSTSRASARGSAPSRPACSPATTSRAARYPSADCNPVELTLRESFRKVVDTDYEPDELRRLPLPGARRLQLRLPPRATPATTASLDSEWIRFISPLQHLGAQPLLRRPGQRRSAERGADRLRHEGDHRGPDRRSQRRSEPRRRRQRHRRRVRGRRRRARAATSSRRSARCPTPSARSRTIPWYIAGDTSLFEPPTGRRMSGTWR